jgi:vitamin B12 transporter
MSSVRPSLARCLARGACLAVMLGSALAPAAARAQVAVQPAPSTADTSHLPSVVVTATRVPFSETVPTASTTVITGQSLQARGIVSVADALRDVAGAAPVETGSMGGLTSLFFRGGESGYVKVLLDGVPLNEPGGVYYFQNLTVADVDRIEIVRGPTSVLYGSDAMTGVIQIFTKRGTGAPAGWLDLSGGSYKSYDGSAGFQGGAGGVGFSVGGTRQTTAGILPFNNQYTNGELGGRLDLGRGTSSPLALTGRYHTADYHFPTVGDGTPVDSNQHRRDEGSTFAVDGIHTFSQALDGRITLTANNEDAADINPQDGPADTIGTFTSFDRDVFRRLGADAHFDARSGRAVAVTFGGSLEGQTDRSRAFDVFNFGGIDTSITSPTAYFRRIEAGYAQLIANAGSQATFSAGGRLDHNSAFGTYGTYRVGAGFIATPGTQFHGELGTAFKEPTFEENFSAVPFDLGNSALRPEHSLGWEAGLTEAPIGSTVAFTATYFNQAFHNIIDYTPAPIPVPGRPSDSTNYLNIAGAVADGAELGLSAGPINGATADLEYTYLDSRVTANGVDTTGYSEYRVGTRLIRRPTHQFSGTLGQTISTHGFFSATVRFVGTRDDINFNAPTGTSARVVLPGYTTIDLAAQYNLAGNGPTGRGFSLIARVVNLLDRRYQEVYSYDAPGRIIFVGFRILASSAPASTPPTRSTGR